MCKQTIIISSDMYEDNKNMDKVCGPTVCPGDWWEKFSGKEYFIASTVQS